MKHLDSDIQLQLGHVRRLKEKIEVLAGRMDQLSHENERTEARVANVNRRRKALETDLKRLQDLESSMNVEVNPSVLRAFDNPMEAEVLTAVEFHGKMVALRSILHDLLLRTTQNYVAAHTEKEDQERDFQERVHDALKARNMLSDELKKVKDRAEDGMMKRCVEYEATQRLEKAIIACDAEIWLSRSDSNRLADQLALLSIEPASLPCKSKRKPDLQMPARGQESVLTLERHVSVQELLSDEATGEQILHQHYDGHVEQISISNNAPAVTHQQGNKPDLNNNAMFMNEIADFMQKIGGQEKGSQYYMHMRALVDKGHPKEYNYRSIPPNEEKKVPQRHFGFVKPAKNSSSMSSGQPKSLASTNDRSTNQSAPPNLFNFLQSALQQNGYHLA